MTYRRGDRRTYGTCADDADVVWMGLERIQGNICVGYETSLGPETDPG